MPNYARKRDANERQIIEALKAAGCLVIQETNIDLYVYSPARDAWFPMEVKTPSGRLTDYQINLHRTARLHGYTISIVTSAEQALEIVAPPSAEP